MKILYSSDEFVAEEGHCIFLCGPTPRSPDVKSWRIDAIAHLESMSYSGTVYVPERKDWSVKFDYLDQVEWEYKGLMHSNCIACWVPRDMKTLPGLTTNVEFGHWGKSPRFLYGRPEFAEHCKYLDWFYRTFRSVPQVERLPIFESLTDLLDAARFWNPIY